MTVPTYRESSRVHPSFTCKSRFVSAGRNARFHRSRFVPMSMKNGPSYHSGWLRLLSLFLWRIPPVARICQCMALTVDVFKQFCPAFERLLANVALCVQKDDDKPSAHNVKFKRKNDQKRSNPPGDTGMGTEAKKKKKGGTRPRIENV